MRKFRLQQIGENRDGHHFRRLFALAISFSKKVVTVPTFLLLLTISLLGCSSSIPARPDKLGLDPIEFSYQSPLRWELPNGLTVYYLYDDELPQMSGMLYLRGGGYYETKDELGVSSATGSQMRAGGTFGVAHTALDRRLDSLGANISSSFDGEFGAVSFYSLTTDFEEVFSLFTDVIRRPRFDQSQLQLWKSLAKEGIKRRKDDPNTMASLAFAQLINGKDSPFAQTATSKDVDKITVESLKKFHSFYVRPNGSILAATGNIPADEFKKLVEKRFGDWKENPTPLKPLPEVTAELKPGVYLLTREFNQATMLIGHRGPTRLSPEMFTSRIFSTAFGQSSFSSVLFEQIRTKLGLAYNAYGGFEGGATSGVFQIYIATRVAQVPLAFKETIRLSELARTELPEAALFKNARDSVERSYVFRFADADKIVTRAAQLELLGYPKDFDKSYLDNIRAVTRGGVKDFAAKEIDPNSFVTVIVGNISAETLRKELGDGVAIHEITFDEVPKIAE